MASAQKGRGQEALKLTLKQEAFCLAYIETGNATEAYRRSYSCGNMKPESVNRKAKELMDNGKITARLEELKKPILDRHSITVDSLIRELEEARMIAAAANTPQASAMIRATLGKAELLGMLGKDKGLDEDEPVASATVRIQSAKR
jgi:phage terminase small subunit